MKRFKQTPWAKALCIILAFICFTASSGMLACSVMTYFYWNNSDINGSWYENPNFEALFSSTTNSVVNNALESAVSNDYKNAIYAEKDNAVASVAEQFNEFEERGDKTDEYGNDYNPDFSYNIKLESYNSSDITFSLSYLTIFDEVAQGEETGEYIENQFDNFAETECAIYIQNHYFSEYDNSFLSNSFKNSLSYASVYDGSPVQTNLDAFDDSTPEYIESRDIYFISRHGELSCKGIDSEFAQKLFSSYIENDKYAQNVDVYIGITLPEDYASSLLNIRYWDDEYINLAAFHDFSIAFEKKLGSDACF